MARVHRGHIRPADMFKLLQRDGKASLLVQATGKCSGVH